MQTEPLQFKAAANELTGGKHVEKLAEGSFKEVFDCGGDVIQVMPIDGSTVINGEEPMPAHEVVPELTAYAQLSLLQTPTPALHDPEGTIQCCCGFRFLSHTSSRAGKSNRTEVHDHVQTHARGGCADSVLETCN